MPRSKYGNKKTLNNGLIFDSCRESRRWSQLVLMEKAGVISQLERQITFELIPSVILDGRKKPSIKYICDFSYIENNKLIIEDVKSEITRKEPVYRIKKHLMKYIHNIEILET